VDFIDADEKRI